MTNLKRHALVGASALIMGVAGLAGSASAELNIYGGGSSLVAPYVRQAMDCYGDKTDLIFFGTPPTTQTEVDFNYTGAPAYDCSASQKVTNRTVNYISTGSGTGINGLYSHDPAFWGDTNPSVSPSHYPSVQFAMSDNSLGSSDVNIYNNGGTEGSVTVVAPGVTPGVGQYGNPHDLYGALIQVPNTIDPVAVAYSPIYEKKRNDDGSLITYRFHIKFTRADSSGGLRLDRTAYCRIFNGQITNWNDPYLKTLNAGQALKDPADPTPYSQWSVPMQIVGREDKSGTTSIFTRHMAAVCAGVSYSGGITNQFDDSHSLLPSSLGGGSGSIGSGSAGNYDKTQVNNAAPGEVLGKFTIANGSDGVAKYVAFTSDPGLTTGDTIKQGRIAYLGPDYVLPAVLNTQANTYGLVSATLKNSTGQWIAPTAHTASVAFGSLQPPQSNGDGTYNAGNTANGLRTDPAAWVQAPSKTAALADPSAASGYPIVGTTQLDTYTCFKHAWETQLISGYLSWFTNSQTVENPTAGLLAKAGLSPLPAAWRKAISQTFVGDPNGLGLNFGTAGSGHCTASTITGG